MLVYLSADIICSEWRTVFCELQGTDNVQGQISEHIFAPNGGYCLYYSSIFYATRAVLKIGEYPRIFPSFSWGIFTHVTRLDQSLASENIRWIISNKRPRGLNACVGWVGWGWLFPIIGSLSNDDDEAEENA